MKNRVCEILNIEKPIIQGPMAWISTAPLVAAVSNAGGLGILGVGFAQLDFVASQIEETKKLTSKPFGINTVMIPDLLEPTTEIIQKMHPPVIYADTLANLDSELCEKYFKLWHEAGCKVIVKVSTINDAIIADNTGADVVIVKGWEGGGHTSIEATTVLVPQAADTIKAPVVAAGGIADGRGMAAAISLGAEAIEMGTVFMAAKETVVHPNVKEAVIKAEDMQTVITGYYTGEPCRQLKNNLSDSLIETETKFAPVDVVNKIKSLAESSLKKAMQDGDIENGAVMAGQIVPLVKEVRSTLDIIDSTLLDCQQVIRDIQSFF